jgi:hypothetical protein
VDSVGDVSLAVNNISGVGMIAFRYANGHSLPEVVLASAAGVTTIVRSFL